MRLLSVDHSGDVDELMHEVSANIGVDTFLTFADDDKDGTHMMRADLQKILANEGISKMNMMLEFLGYDQKTLTFELDEIGERMADLLDEPSRPEFHDLLTI